MTVQPFITKLEYQALLRNDLTSFIQRSFYEINPSTEFMPSPYIDLLASELEKCRDGRTKRLIINLPPRTLKSFAVSVAYVAWLMGHNPAKQIICASYGQDLADKHARDCRTLISSPLYKRLFPATVLSPAKHSVYDFVTTATGCRQSTSVTGVLTGRGADVIILDDVLKPDDALSETRRKAANDWYFNTLLSRLNNKRDGIIILVMQRLHQGDLVGEVLEREHWKVLSLPAIAQRDEEYLIESPIGNSTFHRSIGEALHPERDSIATLASIRESVGQYVWQSQYQQSPVPLEGGLIKREWLRYYDTTELPERFTFIVQSWDTAQKSDQLNDYSVGTTWGEYDQRFYLLDVFRKRVNYPDLKRAVVEQFKKHCPMKILIEDKSSGISLLQELKREGVYSVEAYKVPPATDKLMRLNAQSIHFEQGRVFLPRVAAFLDEYVREITGFPGCKYDDQVDSTTQALDYLGEKSRGLWIWRNLN